MDSSKRRLDSYVESLGSLLPVDWEIYTPHGSKGDYCLFCENKPHEYNAVYHHNTLLSKAEFLGVYSCDDCDMHVTEMIRLHRTEVDSPGTRKVQYPEEVRRLERLQAISGEYTFPLNVDKFLLHYNRDTDAFATHVGHCIVCEQKVESPATLLEVPRDTVIELSGGKVAVCEWCASELPEELIKNPFSWLGCDGPQDERTFHKLQCVDCGGWFIVTLDEYISVAADRTTSVRTCSRCTLEKLVRAVPSDVFYQRRALPVRKDVPYALTNKTCVKCGSNFILESTLSYNYLKLVHETNDGDPMCRTCSIMGMRSVNQNKYYCAYGSYYISVYKQGRVWKYEISKIENYEKRILNSDVDNLADTVAEAFMLGGMVCDSMTGEQLKLFDDGNEEE